MKTLVAPDVCAGCLQPLSENRAEDAYFCAACAGDIHFAQRTPGDTPGLWAPWTYQGAVQHAIVNWKENGIEVIGESLVSEALRLAKDAHVLGEIDVVTPIPPAFLRTIGRGFHPPDLIAHTIGKALGLPVLHRTLKRVNEERQMGKSQGEREQGAKRLFTRTSQCRKIKGLRVLVVDDVCTTGATLKAAVSAFEQSEAKSVRGLVLAMVPYQASMT